MGKKGNKPPQIKEEDYLKVEPDEQWLHTIAGKDFYDDSFYRIIDFFVLHSPCKVSSYSPRTLEYLGWVNPWQSSRFRNAYDEILGIHLHMVDLQWYAIITSILFLWRMSPRSAGFLDYMSQQGCVSRSHP